MRNNLFQAAVPKSMSLQLFPPSSPTIPPGGSVTQQLEVNNPSNAALKMRLKISFIAEGIPIADQVDQLSNFPAMASWLATPQESCHMQWATYNSVA